MVVDVQIPWIAVDPLKPDTVSYPQYVNARPLEVTLRAGDLLYLPSLWFHHVRQTHATIACLYSLLSLLCTVFALNGLRLKMPHGSHPCAIQILEKCIGCLTKALIVRADDNALKMQSCVCPFY